MTEEALAPQSDLRLLPVRQPCQSAVDLDRDRLDPVERRARNALSIRCADLQFPHRVNIALRTGTEQPQPYCGSVLAPVMCHLARPW